MKLVYKPYLDIPWVYRGEREFFGILFTSLTNLYDWKKSDQKKMLPPYAPFLDSPDVGFEKKFKREINAEWLRIHSHLKYPQSLARQKIPVERFHFKSFEIEDLLQDKEQLHRFWLWYRKVFFPK
jgi:hypothetical protein